MWRDSSVIPGGQQVGLFKHKDKLEHELVAFAVRCRNSLVCKQMTAFSPLFLAFAQLVNIPVFLQNELAAKYRLILS